MSSNFFISTAQAAFSLEPAGSVPSVTNAPSLSTGIASVANNVLQILLLIGGVLAVFYLIWAGIQYITSAGSPEKAKSARAGIVNPIAI